MYEKKMMVLPVMIMIALTVSGVAVAHWSDSIQVVGTVNMASLTLVFDNVNPDGYPELPIVTEFWNGNPGEERCGKDVGKTTIVLENLITDPHTGKSGYEVVRITIENAYPCYDVRWTNPIFHNIGITGAKIVGFKVSGTGLTWNPLTKKLENTMTGENVIRIGLASLDPLINVNIDPCNRVKVGEIDIHIEQGAEECHTYEFVIEVLYEQCDV